MRMLPTQGHYYLNSQMKDGLALCEPGKLVKYWTGHKSSCNDEYSGLRII